MPKGAPKPDISTTDAVKRALLAARGIGYSSGPSGVFLEDLFKRWGIWDQVAPKIKQTPPGTPVGSILARGEVDIGFQQVSELLLYPGIQYVGPVPDEMQEISVFNGGVHTSAKEPEAARALIELANSRGGHDNITVVLIAVPPDFKAGMEKKRTGWLPWLIGGVVGLAILLGIASLFAFNLLGPQPTSTSTPTSSPTPTLTASQTPPPSPTFTLIPTDTPAPDILPTVAPTLTPWPTNTVTP